MSHAPPRLACHLACSLPSVRRYLQTPAISRRVSEFTLPTPRPIQRTSVGFSSPVIVPPLLRTLIHPEIHVRCPHLEAVPRHRPGKSGDYISAFSSQFCACMRVTR
ncbi:uncharacterized protein BT62DRAFT_1070909 [Guyanagaster necrorhizus]|uniref:Uncharacterized protein n=1 Tax=Guyanagaster necrorhizus TaxID=856835 RepID=A0A9P7W6A7_9AGAR|nr:uncharacterized protein BT62DRAFT_1070909 [Guyanagaster necrorhizus MCA 3950]KAG7453265.1 hypothetical protein BT62DRAFT_1070909 [Guyanagaster necrorhizus MCA 3950]